MPGTPDAVKTFPTWASSLTASVYEVMAEFIAGNAIPEMRTMMALTQKWWMVTSSARLVRTYMARAAWRSVASGNRLVSFAVRGAPSSTPPPKQASITPISGGGVPWVSSSASRMNDTGTMPRLAMLAT